MDYRAWNMLSKNCFAPPIFSEQKLTKDFFPVVNRAKTHIYSLLVCELVHENTEDVCDN